jgi:uncharacterized protein
MSSNTDVVQGIHDARDVVFAVGAYRGTAAETNKEFEGAFAHVWRMKDGKVVRFRTYTDTHAWLVALGQA